MNYSFRYQIFRYIADLRRMEPENIGIIVQSADDVGCRFRTQLGARKNFDYDNYRRWREFFEVEICEPAVPLFQPPRNSMEFLHYLQQRCVGNYSLTQPLDLVLDTPDLKTALNSLYDALVRTPEEAAKQIRQPVQRLRAELEKRSIIKNPNFHTRELFKAPGLTELVSYYYVRNHGADTPVLIQPVQVLSDIARTINAMERAESLVAAVRNAKVKAEISIVVDEMSAPHRDADETRKWAFDRLQSGKEALKQMDAQIIDSTFKTDKLADGIEKDLAQIAPAQPELAFG